LVRVQPRELIRAADRERGALIGLAGSCRGDDLTVRLTDAAIFAVIIVQVIAGLAAALWRSMQRERRVDLTDLTVLSRSPSVSLPSRRRSGRSRSPGAI
jgi:hypothetical protein